MRLARAWWLLTMGMLVAAVVLGVLGRGVERRDWLSTVILL